MLDSTGKEKVKSIALNLDETYKKFGYRNIDLDRDLTLEEYLNSFEEGFILNDCFAKSLVLGYQLMINGYSPNLVTVLLDKEVVKKIAGGLELNIGRDDSSLSIVTASSGVKFYDTLFPFSKKQLKVVKTPIRFNLDKSWANQYGYSSFDEFVKEEFPEYGFFDKMAYGLSKLTGIKL